MAFTPKALLFPLTMNRSETRRLRTQRRWIRSCPPGVVQKRDSHAPHFIPISPPLSIAVVAPERCVTASRPLEPWPGPSGKGPEMRRGNVGEPN